MTRTRSSAGLVVLLLVALDIPKTYERLAQDGHPTVPLLASRWGERGCRGSDFRIRGELEVVALGRSTLGRWLFGDDAKLGKDTLRVVKLENTTNTHDELDPEFLLVREELAEALK